MKKIYIYLGIAAVAFFVLHFLLQFLSSIPQLNIVDSQTTAIVHSFIFLMLVMVGCTLIIRDALIHKKNDPTDKQGQD